MTSHAFDALASHYDALFTDHRLGRWLRGSVRDRLEGAFEPGHHVLDLGCGTGEDAVWLAQRHVRVTALDASTSMLNQAREKIERTGTADRIGLYHLDIAALGVQLAGLEDHITFDGAYSNFGALNCVDNRSVLARALARRVRSGGRVLLVVMGPACPWEVMAHLSRLRVRAAFRRLRQGGQAALAAGSAIRVWYPSPRRLRREFQPWFRHLDTVGIGVLLPPTDFRHLVDRWPCFFASMAAIERRVAGTFPATWLNDHYLTILERC